MDHFLNTVETANKTHNTLIIGFVWVSIVMYFIIIRGCLGHSFCIEEPNKKQWNSFLNALFSGINKNSIKRFVNWLLCRCYTDEQKTRLYPILIVLNYFYLISTAICVFVWVLSCIFELLQWWSSLLICCRMEFFDFPAMFIITLSGAIKKRKK